MSRKVRILLVCLLVVVIVGVVWLAFHPTTSSDGELLSRWHSRWESWEYIFEVLVILASAGEYITHREWLRLSARRKKMLQHASTIVLIFALSGSLTCLIRTNKLSGDLLSLLGAKAQGAFNNASLANQMATKAEGQASAASKKAGTVQKRLNTSSKELNEIDRQVRAQGPRSKLIAAIAPQLAKKLAKFRGQKVELAVCGTQQSVSQETLDVWGKIATILGPDKTDGIVGAKWKLVPSNLTFSRHCWIRQSGLGVAVSKLAPQKTIEAATTLGDGLARVLPKSSYAPVGFINPTDVKMFVSHGFPVTDLPPGETVAYRPDLIVVTIAAHPSQ